MTKKIMLIDASLPEETRLVIAQDQRIDVFETEKTQKQIKNNIYLAQVTRVESSLQAAFVEYGGNRQGFLAFSEIHPDYFQIPVIDRPVNDGTVNDRAVNDSPVEKEKEETKTAAAEAVPETALSDDDARPRPRPSENYYNPQDLLGAEEDDRFFYSIPEDSAADKPASSDPTNNPTNNIAKTPFQERPHQKYNIQEVIKKRQVLLVQVSKEERGNKGAALTTYLSLAGHYCVLMPNTERSGGVSRRVGSGEARSKLRDLAASLKIPDGMSIILRTAGAQHPQSEIERDLEYLMRLWEKIRSLTLESTAPALIYEEGNLIHRALRDMFKKDISKICIEGEQAYQQAKNFLQMLMPSALDSLVEHKEAKPIFSHYGIEQAIDDVSTPIVQLKSGGYIVINPTEALVAIDVNSGRATSEHNVEDTAVKTNMEAADEIARQARLRDLAGLIVIDFIDMENASNVRDVEKRMRDAVRRDRARIQLGRISQNFGLFEMSRQRLRPELSAGQVESCSQCKGSGQVLTAQTIALRAMRDAISQASQAGAQSETTLRLNWPVVLYILNHKRDEVAQLEQKYGIKLHIEADGIDNPDKPWAIETKKYARPTHPINGQAAHQTAVNVETIYAQMPAAQPQDKSQDLQKSQRHKGRGRSRSRRSHAAAKHDHAMKTQKMRPHGKKNTQPQRQEKAPSLWQRFLGRH